MGAPVGPIVDHSSKAGITSLYNELSKNYNVGDFDTFSEKVSNPVKALSLYNVLSEHYNMPTWNSFADKIGIGRSLDAPSDKTVEGAVETENILNPNPTPEEVRQMVELQKSGKLYDPQVEVEKQNIVGEPKMEAAPFVEAAQGVKSGVEQAATGAMQIGAGVQNIANPNYDNPASQIGKGILKTTVGSGKAIFSAMGVVNPEVAAINEGTKIAEGFAPNAISYLTEGGDKIKDQIWDKGTAPDWANDAAELVNTLEMAGASMILHYGIKKAAPVIDKLKSGIQLTPKEQSLITPDILQETHDKLAPQEVPKEPTMPQVPPEIQALQDQHNDITSRIQTIQDRIQDPNTPDIIKQAGQASLDNLTAQQQNIADQTQKAIADNQAKDQLNTEINQLTENKQQISDALANEPNPDIQESLKAQLDSHVAQIADRQKQLESFNPAPEQPTGAEVATQAVTQDVQSNEQGIQSAEKDIANGGKSELPINPEQQQPEISQPITANSFDQAKLPPKKMFEENTPQEQKKFMWQILDSLGIDYKMDKSDRTGSQYFTINQKDGNPITLRYSDHPANDGTLSRPDIDITYGGEKEGDKYYGEDINEISQKLRDNLFNSKDEPIYDLQHKPLNTEQNATQQVENQTGVPTEPQNGNSSEEANQTGSGNSLLSSETGEEAKPQEVSAEGTQSEQEQPLNIKNDEKDKLREQQERQSNGQENGNQGGVKEGSENGQKGNVDVPGEEKVVQSEADKGVGETAPKTADQKILDAKARIEAYRNKQNLEGQQGIQTQKSGFSIDPELLAAYKDLVAGYIEKGITDTKALIQKLREDFGDLLEKATDKDIREQILEQKEGEKEPSTISSPKYRINDPNHIFTTERRSISDLAKEGEDFHKSMPEEEWLKKAAKDSKSSKPIPPEQINAYLEEESITKNRIHSLDKKINSAIEKGDVVKEAELRQERQIQYEHRDNIKKVQSNSATLWGKIGNLMQQEQADDYSFDAIMDRARSNIIPDKDGNRVIPKETEQIFREGAKNISDLSDKLKNEQGKVKDNFKDFNKASEELQKWKDKVSELEDKLKDAKFPKKTYGSRNKVITTDAYKAAKKALAGKAFVSAIPPPELFTIAGYHLEAGAHEFADFSRKMVKDLGEKVRPYLKDLYAKGVDDLKNKGINIEASPENERIVGREKSYITRLSNQLQDLKDNKPKEPRLEPLDTPHIRELKKNIGEEKIRIDTEAKKLEYQNKTITGKTLAWALKVRQGIGLLDAVTLEKIVNMTGTELAAHPFDEGVNYIARSIFKQLHEGSEISKPTIKSIVKPFASAFSKATIKDAYQKFKTGANSLDLAAGRTHENYLGETGGSLLEKAIGIGARLHGAEKTILQRAIYQESVEKQMQYHLDNGIELTPENMQNIATRADGIALDAIGMNRNPIAKAVNVARQMIFKGNPVENYLFNTINLYKNVPLNIAEKYYVRTGAGFIHGTIQALQKTSALNKSHAWSELTPEQRDKIFDRISKGAIGGLITFAGYMNPQSSGGLYQKGKREEGDLQAGQMQFLGHRLSRLQSLAFASTPLGFAYLVGGTIRRNSDPEYTTAKSGTMQAIKAIGGGIAEKIPYLDEETRIATALESNDAMARWTGDFLASYFEPQMMKRSAAYYDTHPEEQPDISELPQSLVSENPKTIKRYPKTVGEQIKKGIPGLREDVPDEK